MAGQNLFALLGDEGDDVEALLAKAAAKVEAEKKNNDQKQQSQSASAAPPKLPSRPLPPSEYVRGERGRGRGRGRGGRGYGPIRYNGDNVDQLQNGEANANRRYNGSGYSYRQDRYQRNNGRSNGYRHDNRQPDKAANGYQQDSQANDDQQVGRTNDYRENKRWTDSYQRKYANGNQQYDGSDPSINSVGDDLEGQGMRHGRGRRGGRGRGQGRGFNEGRGFGNGGQFVEKIQQPGGPRSDELSSGNQEKLNKAHSYRDVRKDVRGNNGEHTNNGTNGDSDGGLAEGNVTVTTETPENAEPKQRKRVTNQNNSEENPKQTDEDDNNMTLVEYEKLLLEKRKTLEALKTDERKVSFDKDFESMQMVRNKKEDDISNKLTSEKDNLKKDIQDRDQKVRKSISINEFLRASKGQNYGRRGREHSGGYHPRSSVGLEEPRPLQIEDASQFPVLSGPVRG